MAKIELVNISKSYNKDSEAVKNVSFTAERGEFVVLVGPSGCGKSTILRMIAGLEDITGGDLLFNDKRINNMLPKDRDIGMVFQNYALYPHLTVYENIAFPLSIKHEKKDIIKSRVIDAAQMLELHDLLNRKPKELSGGQRQRVALGRAIIRKPQVFLFDEPLSNLDAKLRVQMRTEIINLQRKLGTTSIYVTHDQVEAMTMGSKLVVLKGGEVQQIASPTEIYNNPENEFVAGFIGSPQMNFFRGNIYKSNADNFTFKENESDISFTVPENIFRTIIPSDNKSISLGIRPENITTHHLDTEIGFEADILNIEYIGHEVLIYFKTGNDIKSCRQNSAGNLQIGTKNKFYIEQLKIFAFDESGRRV